jgi:hypothetical protein
MNEKFERMGLGGLEFNGYMAGKGDLPGVDQASRQLFAA